MSELSDLLQTRVLVGVAVILIGLGAIGGALVTYVLCR